MKKILRIVLLTLMFTGCNWDPIPALIIENHPLEWLGIAEILFMYGLLCGLEELEDRSFNRSCNTT